MKNARAAIRRWVTPRSLAAAALGLVCLWAGVQTLRMALFKAYALDEFQYAHAAWLVSGGEVPYRDFFDHHFPLIYQIMSVPFLFARDDPGGIFLLRVFMLPVAMLTAVAAAMIGWAFPSPPRGKGSARVLSALLAPALMFSVFQFTRHAVEIRPDPLAFALLLAALSILYRVPSPEKIDARLTPRVRGALSGLLFAASVWASQKVFVYGLPFVAAIVLDLAWNRRKKRGCLLADPWAFLAGSAAVLAVVALYLTVTRSWAAGFRFCILWPVLHESAGEGFPWQQHFRFFVGGNLWMFPFAAAGIAETVIRLKRSGGDALRDPDLILAASLPAAFISFAVQAAPYPYSMLPVIGILAIFAARGLVLTSRFLWCWRPPPGTAWPFRRAGKSQACAPEGAGKPVGAYVLALVLGLAARGLIKSHGAFERSLAYGNRRQHEVLKVLGELTSPADVCYDNTGCYVARPHASFYYFTSAYMRRTMRDELVRDVPAAIVETGCVASVRDIRFKSLPEELKRFIREHFQPYDGDISLWGSRYAVDPEDGLRSTFLAVRGGTYFVEPATALEVGTLTVNGARVRAPTFDLEKGEARIRYEGEAAEIYILWLPRNGRRYRPRHELRPRLVFGLYE